MPASLYHGLVESEDEVRKRGILTLPGSRCVALFRKCRLERRNSTGKLRSFQCLRPFVMCTSVFLSFLFHLHRTWPSVLSSPLTYNKYPFYITPLCFCSFMLIPVSDLRTVSSILVPGTFIQELKMTEPLEAWDLAMETPLGWLVLFPSIYFMLTFSQMLDAGVTAKDKTDLLPSLLEPELISS